VAALLKANPWIEKEKAFFGQEGSDFDFRAKDVTQCAKRHKELKAEQVRLSLFGALLLYMLKFASLDVLVDDSSVHIVVSSLK
jgi:hypothetical protein